MRRGTTPTHTFDTDISLVEATEIYVTYKQGDKRLDKTKDDLDVTETSVSLELSQEETLMFSEDKCKTQVQIRAKFADGTAVASNISQVTVSPILKEGVI